MEANKHRTRWTYAEFARLPSEGSTRYEVIDGELVVTPAPSTGHQEIVMRLAALLYAFVREHDLGKVLPGPVDVLFAEGDYLEPDIVFVGKAKTHLVTDRGIEGPPDLVIEVASPATAARDRTTKLERYRLFGVPEYWVVDADRGTLEVWFLATGAGEPATLGSGDTLEWTVAGADRPLRVEVAEVLGEA